MRRHGVECFEIDCLGGKLLVLSRSVIVGVATCILLVNPSADCLQLIGSVPLQLVHGIHGQYGLIARLRFLGCILLWESLTLFDIKRLHFTLRSRLEMAAHDRWVWGITLKCLLQAGAVAQYPYVLLRVWLLGLCRIWIVRCQRLCVCRRLLSTRIATTVGTVLLLDLHGHVGGEYTRVRDLRALDRLVGRWYGMRLRRQAARLTPGPWLSTRLQHLDVQLVLHLLFHVIWLLEINILLNLLVHHYLRYDASSICIYVRITFSRLIIRTSIILTRRDNAFVFVILQAVHLHRVTFDDACWMTRLLFRRHLACFWTYVSNLSILNCLIALLHWIGILRVLLWSDRLIKLWIARRIHWTSKFLGTGHPMHRWWSLWLHRARLHQIHVVLLLLFVHFGRLHVLGAVLCHLLLRLRYDSGLRHLAAFLDSFVRTARFHRARVRIWLRLQLYPWLLARGHIAAILCSLIFLHLEHHL